MSIKSGKIIEFDRIYWSCRLLFDPWLSKDWNVGYFSETIFFHMVCHVENEALAASALWPVLPFGSRWTQRWSIPWVPQPLNETLLPCKRGFRTFPRAKERSGYTKCGMRLYFIYCTYTGVYIYIDIDMYTYIYIHVYIIHLLYI